MALHLFNSYSNSKEPFKPIDNTCVTMYVCGPTVYGLAHIGNGLSAVVFDVLFRFLQHSFPKVIYARNITDIDDKIIAAQQDTGSPISDITNRYIAAYQQDVAALGCLVPTLEPRATHHIPEMIQIVERLLAEKHAYEQDGHVLFQVASYRDYGKLSNRSVDDMLHGARVEPAPYKKHPADFVLWKPSADDQPGWHSPWGRGRPGWHLECTAMIHDKFGGDIDIHGGGGDLQFPHHENELAQGVCLKPESSYANYWLHNGMLLVNNAKMSKSSGSLASIRELLAEQDGEVLRYALLSGHYRSELHWSDDLLQQARNSLDRLYRALETHEADASQTGGTCPADIRAALADDLNTPAALSALHKRASALFQNPAPETAKTLVSELKGGGLLLGLCQKQANERLRKQPAARAKTALDPQAIDALIAQRDVARLAQDYSKADAIRDQLIAQHVEIEDTETSSRWRYR